MGTEALGGGRSLVFWTSFRDNRVRERGTLSFAPRRPNQLDVSDLPYTHTRVASGCI